MNVSIKFILFMGCDSSKEKTVKTANLRDDRILKTSLMAESMSLGPHWLYDQ